MAGWGRKEGRLEGQEVTGIEDTVDVKPEVPAGEDGGEKTQNQHIQITVLCGCDIRGLVQRGRWMPPAITWVMCIVAPSSAHHVLSSRDSSSLPCQAIF